jgi:heme-degrading monooxygenase HmoA
VQARVARYEVPPDRCDEAVDAFTSAGSEIAALDGFHSGYLLVDAETGAVVTCTFWDDEASLEAAATRAATARREAVGAVEGDVLSVQTFDVVRDLAAS